MDILLGLVGKDYVMTVADRAQARSIVVFKHDEDKIFQLDSNILMATAGPQGDRANFAEYIQRNIQLYKYRNDLPLTTKGAANFTRTELATFLRKKPYQVNLLMAGYDKKSGPVSVLHGLSWEYAQDGVRCSWIWVLLLPKHFRPLLQERNVSRAGKGVDEEMHQRAPD
mmetsp:Transcript_3588/g.7254  ORF Transcript_3588/g.7254 Transcript_3588/m.7254 type:complete len:169 (-) Transcript_3588:154-660(-)